MTLKSWIHYVMVCCNAAQSWAPRLFAPSTFKVSCIVYIRMNDDKLSHLHTPDILSSLPNHSLLLLLIHLLLWISTTQRATPLNEFYPSLDAPRRGKRILLLLHTPTRYIPSPLPSIACPGEAETSAGVLASGQQMARRPLGYRGAPSRLPSGC